MFQVLKISSKGFLKYLASASLSSLFSAIMVTSRKLLVLAKGSGQPKASISNQLMSPVQITNTFPARNSLLNNVQSMQDLFTKVNINDILQECDFYNKMMCE